MATLDFNVKMKSLDGTEGNDTIAKALAMAIGQKQKGDTVKVYGWYQDLLTGKALNLDKADQKTFRDMVEQDENMFIFFKGQILEILDAATNQK